MSDDVEPLPRDVLHVETRRDGAGPIIIVVGELDMTGTEQFWAHVSEAVEARPVSLTMKPAGLRSSIRLDWRPWCGLVRRPPRRVSGSGSANRRRRFAE
jgi:hypothetical protein